MTILRENPKAFKWGALAWILSIQYYAVQVFAARGWPDGYSWRYNTISDLGNTRCGLYGGAFVCSPRHLIMNASFILLGITMIAGAVFIGRHQVKNRLVAIGFSCLALAGAGTILVGVFPENSYSGLHIIGAALPFIFGSIGLLMVGMNYERLPRWLRAYSAVSGLTGLIALGLFVFHIYSILGIGGTERIVAYPQTIWMIVTGSYFLILQNRENIA